MKKQKHEVFPHFSVEVVKQRYLECECLRERTHWHIIWLLADTRDSRTPRQVAEIVGCTPDWVRKLLKRYNAEGEAALRDKRKNNTGVRFLDETQQAALAAALSAPPGDGGLWTGPKVAAWISETLQRRVSDVSGWKYLKRLGYTLQTPRPQHQAAATPEAQQTFKKKLKERVATLEKSAPRETGRDLGRRRDALGIIAGSSACLGEAR